MRAGGTLSVLKDNHKKVFHLVMVDVQFSGFCDKILFWQALMKLLRQLLHLYFYISLYMLKIDNLQALNMSQRDMHACVRVCVWVCVCKPASVSRSLDALFSAYSAQSAHGWLDMQANKRVT